MPLYYELEKCELRDIIFGRVQYKKCPACDTDGYVWYNGETGCAALPSPDPSWGEWTECQECDECNGLGYISYRTL
jgi:hypothetical protein